jgi:hypothetical protein
MSGVRETRHASRPRGGDEGRGECKGVALVMAYGGRFRRLQACGRRIGLFAVKGHCRLTGSDARLKTVDSPSSLVI